MSLCLQVFFLLSQTSIFSKMLVLHIRIWQLFVFKDHNKIRETQVLMKDCKTSNIKCGDRWHEVPHNNSHNNPKWSHWHNTNLFPFIIRKWGYYLLQAKNKRIKYIKSVDILIMGKKVWDVFNLHVYWTKVYNSALIMGFMGVSCTYDLGHQPSWPQQFSDFYSNYYGTNYSILIKSLRILRK